METSAPEKAPGPAGREAKRALRLFTALVTQTEFLQENTTALLRLRKEQMESRIQGGWSRLILVVGGVLAAIAVAAGVLDGQPWSKWLTIGALALTLAVYVFQFRASRANDSELAQSIRVAHQEDHEHYRTALLYNVGMDAMRYRAAQEALEEAGDDANLRAHVKSLEEILARRREVIEAARSRPEWAGRGATLDTMLERATV